MDNKNNYCKTCSKCNSRLGACDPGLRLVCERLRIIRSERRRRRDAAAALVAVKLNSLAEPATTVKGWRCGADVKRPRSVGGLEQQQRRVPGSTHAPFDLSTPFSPADHPRAPPADPGRSYPRRFLFPHPQIGRMPLFCTNHAHRERVDAHGANKWFSFSALPIYRRGSGGWLLMRWQRRHRHRRRQRRFCYLFFARSTFLNRDRRLILDHSLSGVAYAVLGIFEHAALLDCQPDLALVNLGLGQSY